jgi:hypothetical protein
MVYGSYSDNPKTSAVLNGTGFFPKPFSFRHQHLYLPLTRTPLIGGDSLRVQVAQKFAREASYLKSSATYTLWDDDGCTKLNATGGSFPTTLYNPDDFTGRLIYLQNSATSRSNGDCCGFGWIHH